MPSWHLKKVVCRDNVVALFNREAELYFQYVSGCKITLLYKDITGPSGGPDWILPALSWCLEQHLNPEERRRRRRSKTEGLCKCHLRLCPLEVTTTVNYSCRKIRSELKKLSASSRSSFARWVLPLLTKKVQILFIMRIDGIINRAGEAPTFTILPFFFFPPACCICSF